MAETEEAATGPSAASAGWAGKAHSAGKMVLGVGMAKEAEGAGAAT